MLIDRKIRLATILRLTKNYWLWMTLYCSSVVIVHTYVGFKWLQIPWAVLTVIGTAVAFYIGFKNNSSYDRQWEARKIWGSIVNSSRSWGIMVKDYVTDTFAEGPVDPDLLNETRRELIYRHIAWLYCLRRQLWKLQPWEHNTKYNQIYRERYAEYFAKNSLEDEISEFLEKEEARVVLAKKNPATQLVAIQSRRLAELRGEMLIDDFRHVEMTNLLVELYNHQGKCERIKNFPFPRQYANSSMLFILIFLALVPFGVISEFELGHHTAWLTVPFSLLIGWVYWIMEIVGDYAENPFCGLALDTPMTSLCRTIEIDLRDMLDEPTLPSPVDAVDGVIL